jgi:hypothetical protein
MSPIDRSMMMVEIGSSTGNAARPKPPPTAPTPPPRPYAAGAMRPWAPFREATMTDDDDGAAIRRLKLKTSAT